MGAASDGAIPVLPGENPPLLINGATQPDFFQMMVESTHPAALNHHFPPVLPPKGGMFDVTARALAFRERCL